MANHQTNISEIASQILSARNIKQATTEELEAGKTTPYSLWIHMNSIIYGLRAELAPRYEIQIGGFYSGNVNGDVIGLNNDVHKQTTKERQVLEAILGYVSPTNHTHFL